VRLIVENRFALLGLVLVALTALFGVAHVTRGVGTDPGADTTPPEAAPVESALRVCPPPQGGDRDSTLAGFTPAGSASEGALTVTENTADATELGTAEQTGRQWTLDTGDAERHTVVRAEGALASGLEAAQTTVGDDGPHTTAVRCAEPGISTWFTVPGGDELEGLRLLIANVDATPATVNVDLYATDGPASSADTRGVAVDPHGEAEIDLGALVDGTGSVAVHVRTNAGRVASSLFAERTDEGADWVPPTAAPAERHVIPAVPDGGGTRRLIVAAPGDDPVTASLRVITPEGEAEHEDLSDLSVPPAAASSRGITAALGEEPGTVVVEADRPVVAGVVMERADGDDTAYASAVPPLAGPLDTRAVLPGVPDGAGAQLALTALDGPASAVVTPVGAEGAAGEPVVVEVEPGRVVVPEVDAPDSGYTLVVETDPGSSPLYAGQVLTRGSGGDRGTAARPAPPAPAEVLLPHADDSLTAVVP
jgi:hypothetical protein